MGDKIKIKIQMYEDDNLAELKIKNEKCILEDREKRVVTQSKKDGVLLKTKGNKYGLYQFKGMLFYHDKEEKLVINFLKNNQWNIKKLL